MVLWFMVDYTHAGGVGSIPVAGMKKKWLLSPTTTRTTRQDRLSNGSIN